MARWIKSENGEYTPLPDHDEETLEITRNLGRKLIQETKDAVSNIIEGKTPLFGTTG